MRTLNIIISNSVPLNGGDEALLRATVDTLKREFQGCKIVVLCSKLDMCNRYLSDLYFEMDLDVARMYGLDSFQSKFKYKLRLVLFQIFGCKFESTFSMLFANSSEKKTLKIYKKSDIIITSAGGYIHDFYSIKERLHVMQYASSIGKKVVIFAQSVGPFWKQESKQQIKEVFKGLSAVLVREEKSFNYLKEIGADYPNVQITGDAAFLLHKLLEPQRFLHKPTAGLVAMCFREWPLGTNELEVTLRKAAKLCEHILRSDVQKKIIFLSTCQGIENYVDDSKQADKIVALLDKELQARCVVDGKKYSLPDLIAEYAKCESFVGMRLHSAILSMLGGTPAMGLGYEDKTEGIFRQMQLDDYQVFYDKSLEEWTACYDRFARDLDQIKNDLPAKLDEMYARSYLNIESIHALLNSKNLN